jgi:hypothetical protein
VLDREERMVQGLEEAVASLELGAKEEVQPRL